MWKILEDNMYKMIVVDAFMNFKNREEVGNYGIIMMMIENSNLRTAL